MKFSLLLNSAKSKGLILPLHGNNNLAASRDLVLFSILVSMLIISVFTVNLNQVFAEDSSIVLKPTNVGLYYNDWQVFGTPEPNNKWTAVSDSRDSTGIVRQSNSKFQDLSFANSDLTFPENAQITHVLYQVTAKNGDGSPDNTLSLAVFSGTSSSGWNFGPDNKIPTGSTMTIERDFPINPVTNSPWTVYDIKNWVTPSGIKYNFGLSETNKQKSAPIQVSEMRLIVYTKKLDTVPPIVTVTPTTLPNANGWYVNPVTFTVKGDDGGGSGIAFCDTGLIYSGPDGSGLTVSATCTDNAGNIGTGISQPFNYDATKPTGSFVIERTDAVAGQDENPERTFDRHVNLVVRCTDDISNCTVTFSGDLESSSNTSGVLTSGRGIKTVSATIADEAGNTESFSDKISLDARITNLSVDEPNPFWGQNIVFSGIVINALSDDTIRLNLGSPTLSLNSINDDGTFSITSTYPKISEDSPNPHQPVATLTDNIDNPVTNSDGIVNYNGPQIIVKKHPTTLTLDNIFSRSQNDDVTFKGNLTDNSYSNTGIDGKTITFSVTTGNNIPNTTTSGFTITDPHGIIIDNQSGDYMLSTNDAVFSFPSNPPYVTLVLANMDYNSVKVELTTGNGQTIQTIGYGKGINLGNFVMQNPSGISSIRILEVSFGNAGITAVSATDIDGIEYINEQFSQTISDETSLSFQKGQYLSRANSGPNIIPNIDVTSSFSGDLDYDGSSDTKSYTVDYQSAGGYGGTVSIISDSNTGITSILCSPGNDNDGDALCNDWEGTDPQGHPNGIPILDASGQPTGQVYILPGSDPNRKDVYVEYDFMAGHDPEGIGVAGAIQDVVNAFANAPVTNSNGKPNGINLHVERGQTIPHQNNMVVWTDFNSLKATYFGNPGETSLQKNARAQAYHYFIFAHSIGGASGVAETNGNDGVISLGEGFGETNPSHLGTEGTRNEIAGTFMHELGHQFKLNHGGPINNSYSDNGDNCKPNQDSVMSYSRQFPILLNETKWVLDYSNGGLGLVAGYRESGGAIPTAGNIKESGGNLQSADNPLTPGTDPLPWIIWGAPGTANGYKTKQASDVGVAGNIDWDGNGIIDAGSNLVRNINGLGFYGCEASNGQSTKFFKNYNEWAELDYNFRDSTGTAFDGARNQPIADIDTTIYSQMKALGWTLQGVTPWDTNSFTTSKAGSTLEGKFKIFDNNDNQLTVPIVSPTYKVYDSSGNYIGLSGTFKFDPKKQHFATQFTTPSAGIYYIQVVILISGTDTNKPLQDPDMPYYVNGIPMSMKFQSK